ncbi:MAG: leucyl-tRNA synthetase [Parcubacteria group bacterium]|nr:leucyl-tRNA synthetase [Parcubacteria group bacterium]
MSRDSFDHKAIEKKAQDRWAELDLYTTDLTDDTKDPYYLLFEFPYPSGDLHIGHWYAFALTDIFARKQRMDGKNVLFPIGFDAFGLPAENAAIKNGVDPKKWTYENMDRMRTQIRSMGASLDWSKEIVSCDPSYYKWTQWLFTKLFEHGLAERKNALVKWCPKDQTVLANEQVNDGHCERCGTEVEEKNLTQWFFKITQYAERLLTDLDGLPWREDIKDAQRAWIGESEGAKLTFMAHGPEKDDTTQPIPVFTTRPDTVFGATYLVLAPEHEMIEVLIQDASNPDAVREYQRATARKTERDRSENKEKTGVPLEGITATNPATKEEVPVYIADYVLNSYGTGAVMAVPAHDERDFEFATKFNLPVKQVVRPRFVDESNPPREGKETVERDMIIGLVRNPKNGKFLCLNWKEQPWTTFVVGGIETGEDSIEAAVREIHEETGYRNITFVRKLGGISQTEYFATHKDENRIAYTQAMLFDLVDEEQEALSPEEAAKHELVWLSPQEITSRKIQHAEFATVWQRLQNGIDTYVGDGILFNSDGFDGRDNREAMADIVEFAGGERVKNYRIRDWLVSRQRYWGAPIPVVYDPEGNVHLVPADHLPWLLPEDVDFTPGAAGAGKSPLATSKELHERVTRIFGEGWVPEYDTLDTFVDSSWYYLRYLDPKDDHDFSDQSLMKKWMPVDRYSGGSEHTTMHLLYARFFNKALYDLALVPTSEPFGERFNRGLILGPDGAKMSKSKGNVVNPDGVVEKFGADAVRMYLAFIGPYNEPGNYPWNLDGTFAMRKFLDRVNALYEKKTDAELSDETTKHLALAIKKIGTDIDRFKFNTAISTLMTLVRELEQLPQVPMQAKRTLLILLAPLAPHLAEHLWSKLGEEGSVHQAQWPAVDESLLAVNEVTVTVQIQGKRRGEITLRPDSNEDEALMLAKSIPTVAKAIEAGPPKRVIYVQGRILNLVF